MSLKIVRQIDELGRIVIPKDLRKQYGIKPGERLYFETHDDGILIHRERYAYGSDEQSDKKTDRALILSDVILYSVLAIEAESLGITTEEYVDRFLDAFYDDPKKFKDIIKM